jgi:uncharacterized protein (TIGR02145 family)
MKTTRLLLSIALALFSCTVMQSQVLIGGTDRPRDGAILDLNSTAKGGLILSNVTISSLEFIPYDTHLFPGIDAFNADVNPELRGAMVYNDGKNAAVPAGIYIWNGCSWTKDGGGINSLPAPSVTVNGSGSTAVTVGESLELKVTTLLLNVNYTWYKRDAVSAVTLVGTGASLNTSATTEGTCDYYCVVASDDCSLSNGTSSMLAVTVNPVDPATIPDGTVGTFTGKLCFDVALGNFGDACGPETSRSNQQTDFSNRTKQDGASEHYSGVQVYTFSTNSGVNRVRFAYVDESGLVIDSIVPASPDYATADNINEAKVAVYYKTALNTALKERTRADALKVKLYVIYNVDADFYNPSKDEKMELNISLQDCACCGAYVAPGKWLNFLCHNLGADESANPFTPAAAIHGAKYKWGVASPAITQAEDQNQTNNNGFGRDNWLGRGTPPNTSLPWNMTTANPCPVGWRVPSLDEWFGVENNNSKTYVGNWTNNSTYYSSGLQLGYALFLPAAGTRIDYSGALEDRGSNGNYWTSSAYDIDSGHTMYFHGSGYGMALGYRHGAISVRCVAD